MNVDQMPKVEAIWKGEKYAVSLIWWPGPGSDGAVFLDEAAPAPPHPLIAIHEDGTEEVIGWNRPLDSGRCVGLSEIDSLVFSPPCDERSNA